MPDQIIKILAGPAGSGKSYQARKLCTATPATWVYMSRNVFADIRANIQDNTQLVVIEGVDHRSDQHIDQIKYLQTLEYIRKYYSVRDKHPMPQIIITISCRVSNLPATLFDTTKFEVIECNHTYPNA